MRMGRILAATTVGVLTATLTTAPADAGSPGLTDSAAAKVHDALAADGVSEANIAKVLARPRLANAVVTDWTSQHGVKRAASGSAVAASGGPWHCWEGYVRKNGNNHLGVTMIWFEMDTHWCSRDRTHKQFDRYSTIEYGTPGIVWGYDGEGPGKNKLTNHGRKWVRKRSGKFSFPLAWFAEHKTLWTWAAMYGDGTFKWDAWSS